MTEFKEQVKVLHTLMNESNEFKRYMLMQLWINQFFSSTIIDPIKALENKLKDTSTLTDTSVDTSSIYDVFRSIRVGLEAKNIQLEDVYQKMLHKRDILKVMNDTLELNANDVLTSYSANCDKVKAMIDRNTKYIALINNLSESKIARSLNDDQNK